MAYLGREAAKAPLVTADIPTDSINSDHYVDGSIDNAHIADDAIDSEHYAAVSIDTAHIGDDQVTADKLANSINTAIAANTAKVSFTPDAAQVFNDTGADEDFRIETSGQANMFVVDGGLDKVGIGLEGVASGDFSDGRITIYNSDTNYSGLGIKMDHDGDNWALIMDATKSGDHDVGMKWSNQGTAKWHLVTGSVGGATLHFKDAGEDHGMYLATDTNSWTSGTSDERRKTDWVNFTDALNKINTLTKVGNYKSIDPVTGEYKNEEHILTGLSAQEIQGIIPSAVDSLRRSETVFPDDDTEYLTLRYQDVFVLGIKAIQELSALNDALEAENTALKTRMDTLEARVTALEG